MSAAEVTGTSAVLVAMLYAACCSPVSAAIDSAVMQARVSVAINQLMCEVTLAKICPMALFVPNELDCRCSCPHGSRRPRSGTVYADHDENCDIGTRLREIFFQRVKREEKWC